MKNGFVSAEEFYSSLKNEHGNVSASNLTVDADVFLEPERIGIGKSDGLTLSGIKVSGSLYIRDFHMDRITLDQVSCTRGMYIERFEGRSVCLKEVSAPSLTLNNTSVSRAVFADLEISGPMNISGLTVASIISITGVQCESLELLGIREDAFVKAKLVKTCSLDIALQFHLAGIPAFVPSSEIRALREQVLQTPYVDR